MTRHLALERSHRALLHRVAYAFMVAALPLIVLVGLWVISLLTWSSGPHPSELLWLAVPCTLASAWVVRMALARGSVEVGVGEIVVRHPRLLRRPLRITRRQVRTVALDEGWSGNARFPTERPGAPFLWAGRRPARQEGDRPLLGDGALPNLALVLDPPLRIRDARDALSAVSTPYDPAPPSRRVPAEVVFLTLADPAAARAVFAAWPLDDAQRRDPLPDPVASPAQPAPEILAAMAIASVAAVAAAATAPWWLLPLVIAALTPLVARGVRRNRASAERALELAGTDPHAQAAVRANREPTVF